MRAIRYITLAFLAMIFGKVSAQYYDDYGNWHDSRYVSNRYINDYEESWGTFYGGYAPMQLTTTAKNGESSAEDDD